MANPRKDRQPVVSPDYDPELVALNFEARRKHFGWTIEELARRSGVSRDTIMRIEKGLSARYSSIRKLRAKLQFFSEQLTKNSQESSQFAVHRKAKNRWLVGSNRDHRGRTVSDADFLYVDDENERKRQAGLGFQKFFNCILRSELPAGILDQAIMELYETTPFDRHYGEEFIYCLEGAVEMSIGGDTCVLEVGDSIVFDAGIAHRYKPHGPVSGKHSPARILMVVGIRPDEAERMKKLDLPNTYWGV